MFSFVIVLIQDEFDIYRTTSYPVCISGWSLRKSLSDTCFGSIQYQSECWKSSLKLVKNASSAIVIIGIHMQVEKRLRDPYGASISTCTKFSEKLIFLTPWYAHVRVRIRGLKIIVFRKFLRTYLVNDLLRQ